jgi:hypothetical protein
VEVHDSADQLVPMQLRPADLELLLIIGGFEQNSPAAGLP